MPIVNNIKRIIKASFKDLLKTEQPEKTLDQMLEEMQHELREAKIQVADAIRDQNKLGAEYKKNLQSSDKWEQRAVELVKEGDDARAKEALRRKKEFDKLAEIHKEPFELQKQSVATLKHSLKALESKIEETQRKRTLLSARKKSAEARRSIGQSMAGASSSKTDNVLDQIEDNIVDVEADARATSETQKVLKSRSVRLERNDESELDDELAKIKEKVKG